MPVAPPRPRTPAPTRRLLLALLAAVTAPPASAAPPALLRPTVYQCGRLRDQP
ncbi:hypothetical protein ACLQ3B_11515 [Micromonospora sp. DT53]|uniref:hypothetical protein n=1 Tax=Micromonospora sp. DT53 TaxID=3393444 RepID=UPI003CF9EFE2